jgi:hypothetical protein
MRAGTVVDYDALLDELEFRLMRCSGSTATTSASLRKGGVLAVGEQAHRVARSETRHFWNEHKLSHWPRESILRFVDEVLARQPRYLAWALVPLLTDLATHLVTGDTLTRMIEWITDGEPVDRVVRDAFTLTVIVEWLRTLPATEAMRRLLAMCEDSGPDRIRMGYIGLGAYLRSVSNIERENLDAAFLTCLHGSTRVDVETSLAVGWALREVLVRDPERFIGSLEKHVSTLSRQVFRTAVERLPQPMRARLAEKWLRFRRGRSGLAKESFDTGIRSRRIPMGHR